MTSPGSMPDASTWTRRLVVVAVLMIVLIGPAFGPIPRALASRMDLQSATLWQIVAFLVPVGIVFAVVLRYLRRDGSTLASLGWRQPTRASAVILAVLLGLFWAALGTMGYLQFQPDANPLELSLFRLVTAVVTAAAAPMEDIVVRGFLMQGLRQLRVPTWIQLVASSVLFAVYHSVWGFNIFGFIFSLFYGLLLGGLYLIGKRSLTPVVIGHSLSLLIGEPFLTMSLLVAQSM